MPQVIKTLDDIINREDRYDVNKVTLFTITDDQELVIPDKNIFDTYMRFIRPYVQVYDVTMREREYYRFRPQLLSLDVYGTPSLDWLLIMLNDRECPSKFYLKQTVNMVPSSIIGKLHETIVSRPKRDLEKNWNKYLRLIGEDVTW
ncbi:MAG: baseplate wedge protein 53 [Ruminococcus flavefaciens]|nr:baseplate wedge protein 53 [Ruminococcus flavefaciens]